MIGRSESIRSYERKRPDGGRFLAFGAPLILLVYYIAILVIADLATGGEPVRASVSPVLFTEEIIEEAATAPSRAHTKAVGDIDGDGLPDVIIGGAKGDREGLFWYTNPSWTKNTIVPSSGSDGFSTDMQVGDVDNDGDLDIVVPRANGTGGIGAFVKWFENPRPAGNPATDPWTEHHIGDAAAHDVELGDLNNDGLLDVVVRKDAVTIFVQVDAKTDQWIQSEVNVRGIEGMALGDFDNDNDLDIATNGYWLENRFLPDGDAAMIGTWAEWTIDASRNAVSKTFASDINADGQVDVILNTSELRGGELAWYEPSNPADATAGPWTKHSIGFVNYDHSIQTGDIDLDGDLDVIVAEMHQSNDPDEVLVFYNLDGAGLVWDSQVIDNDGSHNIRVIDIDLDGDLDIVGANWSGGPISLWRNQPGLLDSWERTLVEGARPWTAVLIDSADIDGDGLKDIVTGGWWYKNPGTPSGVWLRNTIGAPLHNMAAVFDIDGDTDLDVLGTAGKPSSSHLLWAENDGLGVFTIHENVPAGSGDFLQGVTVGPITGSLTEVYLSWHSASPAQVLTVPADPILGTWTIGTATVDTQNEDLSQGDIDNDTDTDLLLGTRWLENDAGSWVTHDLFSPLGVPDRNELADINGDGRLDSIVGYEAISQIGKLAWYEQGVTATALWTEHIISDTVVGPMSLDVRDMDGDGDFDVTMGEHNTSNSASARVIVFENLDGVGGSWKEHVVYTGDEHHDGTQTTDIDGDGDFDIISIGWLGGVFLYENQAGASAGPALPVARPDSYAIELETLLSISAPGVLGNDVKPGTGIVATLDSDVTDGTLNLNSDGSFTYTSNIGFIGSDSFDYTVSNSTDTSAPATVTINVTGPNFPPVAFPDSESVNKGGLLSMAAPGVLGNDTDPEGDTLQAQLVTPPLFGELTLNSNGSFDYVHLGSGGASDSFTYNAFDGSKISGTVTVSIAITAALPREQNGLVALYSFDEGTGTTVTDVSGVGAALDLTILSPAAVTWTPGGLSVDSSSLISSGVAATKVIDAATASNSISIEAWIKPTSLSQTGPARIVSLSDDTLNRNFTLGQQNTEFETRLKTTSTNSNGTPATTTTGTAASTSLTHVLYTRDAAGNVTVYVDGSIVQTGTVAGDFSGWNSTYELGLANELSFAVTPSDARPWLGEFRLVAIYSTALTGVQVAANYAAGPEPLADSSSWDVDGTVSLLGVLTGTAAFTMIAPEVMFDSGSGPQIFPVAADGSFTATVEEGTYTVTASAIGFVGMELTGQSVLGTDMTLPAVQLDPGLVDADAFVSGSDISALLANMGLPSTDRTNGTDSNIVDLDADGSVNGLDLSLVLNSFGKSSPQSGW